MQFNMYHHYTVDEHLIRAVGNVAAIERGELKKEHPLATEIIKRIKSRGTIYCAMLLHDIAKGLPGDHSDVGAAIAESLCPRLGLSPAETAKVAWLVQIPPRNERHRPAPRHRRSEDGARFRGGGAVAGDAAASSGADRGRYPRRGTGRVERLEGPASARALSRSRGGDVGRRRHARARRAHRGGQDGARRRIADLPECAHRALSRHYDAYWLSFDEAALERHARIMAEADAKGELLAVSSESNDFRAVTDIVIYTPDHPGLFFKLAGAISLSGGSIVDAKAFTTTDGFALDVFSVQDAEGGPFDDIARLDAAARHDREDAGRPDPARARCSQSAAPKRRTRPSR